ncbi:MAG: 3-deoxy-D-manno-octulosonic acid transferase [Bacteroidia bacterium]|nr:3-deoxy-D-manno-octulosonic acid transferase [Bacteroidia bacterium]
MLFLYNIGIRLYGAVVLLASLSNKKAKLFSEGRKNWKLKLTDQLKNVPETNRIWFHCASLGEFEQARPLIEKITEKHEKHPIIVSFFSPSGYEIRKNYSLATVCYLPLDTKKNAEDFIDIVKPSKVFFVKYEFWYHYILTLSKRNIPVYLVSAVFRPNQVFFKWYGKMFYGLLEKFRMIFVQNEASEILLKEQGVDNVMLSGDTRYDRVLQTAEASEKNYLIERFTNSEKTLILGSSWPEEEDILIEFLKQNIHPLKVIIAPHDISENHINNLLKKLDLKKPVLYSKSSFISDSDILILDTIGHLASAYRYADIALIGGGFGRGLHNILEPAVFGMPVLFGNDTAKYPEATLSVKAGFGHRLNNAEDLIILMKKFQEDDAFLVLNKHAAITFVKENSGATDLVIRNCF